MSKKGSKLPVEILTAAEVRMLLDACSRVSSIGCRNRALIAVLYRSGLRISEALALFVKDLNPEAGTINVLHGKGNKSRISAMDPQGFDILQAWIERRDSLGLNGRHRVFCTLQGKALSDIYCRALFARLGAKAGIEKRVHPHCLRHTHAAELAREGVPLNVIQAQLGHSSAATTARYLAHIAPQLVVDTMKARVWTA